MHYKLAIYMANTKCCHDLQINWTFESLTEGILYCWYLNSWIVLPPNSTLLNAPQIEMISQYVCLWKPNFPKFESANENIGYIGKSQ